jgi:hypothetical protein
MPAIANGVPIAMNATLISIVYDVRSVCDASFFLSAMKPPAIVPCRKREKIINFGINTLRIARKT